LREERVTLQRTPVNRPATAADLNAFQEGQIELHETAERAVVSRTANVVEEISVGKEVTEREEVIRDTVRKTEVDVEQLSSTEQPIRTGLTGTEGDEVTYSSR
jgi:stress response protein YsnF